MPKRTVYRIVATDRDGNVWAVIRQELHEYQRNSTFEEGMALEVVAQIIETDLTKGEAEQRLVELRSG